MLENELRVAHGNIAKIVPVKNARAVGESPQHESVPTGDHLLVSTRALPVLSDLEQAPLDATERFNEHAFGDSETIGDIGGRAGRGQNCASFKVATRLDVEPKRGNCGVLGAKRLVQFFGRPCVEQPLVPRRVGIEGGVEPTVRIGQLAGYEVKRLLGYLTVPVVAIRLEARKIGRGELRIVVEHRLEMRHQPDGIDGITMKSAANVVVNAAAGHTIERPLHHNRFSLSASALVLSQQELERGWLWKFWCAAESTVPGIERLGKLLSGLSQNFRREIARLRQRLRRSSQ